MSQTTMWIVDTFLWLFAFMVARSREVRTYQVILIALAGFLLAGTPLSYPAWYIIKLILKPFG